MIFIITSKLSNAERARLNRAAERFAEQGDANATPGAFVHAGPNTYAPLHDGVDVHLAARHAMVVANTVFEYEVK